MISWRDRWKGVIPLGLVKGNGVPQSDIYISYRAIFLAIFFGIFSEPIFCVGARNSEDLQTVWWIGRQLGESNSMYVDLKASFFWLEDSVVFHDESRVERHGWDKSRVVSIYVESWTNIDRPKTASKLQRYQICRSQSMLFLFLGGGFKYFYFHRYLGKISNLTNVFQRGWNHQPGLCWMMRVYRTNFSKNMTLENTLFIKVTGCFVAEISLQKFFADSKSIPICFFVFFV